MGVVVLLGSLLDTLLGSGVGVDTGVDVTLGAGAGTGGLGGGTTDSLGCCNGISLAFAWLVVKAGRLVARS